MSRSLLACLVAGVLGAQQPMHLVANIPAFRLEVRVGDSVTHTFGIAPGMSRYRTPRGTFAISSIEWNPWWIPPNSSWAAKEKPMPPGPSNPMGPVKLNFRPLYFLHGTPFEHSIGSAASHGCIRLSKTDAMNLARLVLRAGFPGLPPEEIDRLSTDTAGTLTINLERPVPIEIRYDLVEVRDGRLMVYRDVYGLATSSMRAEVYRVLADRGIDTAAVDPARVAAFVRRIAATGNSILIDSLMIVPKEPGAGRQAPADSERIVLFGSIGV